VRNKDYKTKRERKKKKKKKKEPPPPPGSGDAKPEEAKEASRIKAYDYRSWDTFDVVDDAFCQQQQIQVTRSVTSWRS